MLTLAIVLALAAPPQPACILPDGARVRLELAVTDEEKALGLMFRDTLAEDAGMLFVFDADGTLPFWMKNTMIPLDLVWLSAEGKVVEVRTVPPCRLDPCTSYQNDTPARAVLELNSGAASRHGLAPGAAVRFENVKGFPPRR